MKHLKIASALIITLGVIHIAATPVIMNMFNVLNKTQLLVFTYMFVATGAFMSLIGWMQYALTNNMAYNAKIIRLLFVSNALLICSGISAIVIMSDNPFAYLSLLFAAYQFFGIWHLKTKNQQHEVVAQNINS